MESYIAQKAQQALEALCGPEPLPDRLVSAYWHIQTIANDHFLKTAPEEVREYVTKFMACDVQQNPAGATQALRHTIQSIFEECGRKGIREGYDQHHS
jgi:hypothetical protein